MQQIAASPYLRAIAALILVSSFVTAIVAWQFRAIAVEGIKDKNGLAAFFGSFTFYTGLLSLALQWLLTSRLLRRYGLGVALSIVPTALALGSVGLLVSGSFAAAILLRGSDQVLRYSIDRPAAELLYLPLPAAQTLQVKSFIDTVVWRLGDGLSGLVILLLATVLHWPAWQISWVNLLLLAGWLTAAWVAQRQYVTNLGKSIDDHRRHVQRANVTVLDKAATEILTAQMASDDPERILYALELFTAGHSGASHPVVRGLLKHGAAAVRRARGGGAERGRRPLRAQRRRAAAVRSRPLGPHRSAALHRAPRPHRPARTRRAARQFSRFLHPLGDGVVSRAARRDPEPRRRPT